MRQHDETTESADEATERSKAFERATTLDPREIPRTTFAMTIAILSVALTDKAERELAEEIAVALIKGAVNAPYREPVALNIERKIIYNALQRRLALANNKEISLASLKFALESGLFTDTLERKIVAEIAALKLEPELQNQQKAPSIGIFTSEQHRKLYKPDLREKAIKNDDFFEHGL